MRNDIFLNCFFDRQFIAKPDENFDDFQIINCQSPSNHNQVVWYVKIKHQTIDQILFQVLGPPTVIASCAWLAKNLQGATLPCAQNEWINRCQLELGLPYPEKQYIQFVFNPLREIINPKN